MFEIKIILILSVECCQCVHYKIHQQDHCSLDDSVDQRS